MKEGRKVKEGRKMKEGRKIKEGRKEVRLGKERKEGRKEGKEGKKEGKKEGMKEEREGRVVPNTPKYDDFQGKRIFDTRAHACSACLSTAFTRGSAAVRDFHGKASDDIFPRTDEDERSLDNFIGLIFFFCQPIAIFLTTAP
jgi:hypothetical protein